MRKRALYTAQSPKRLTASLTVLFTATCVSMLMGCASPSAPSEARTPLPANLVTPCRELEPLTDGTARTVLRWITEAAEAYKTCRDKQDALVEALRLQ